MLDRWEAQDLGDEPEWEIGDPEPVAMPVFVPHPDDEAEVLDGVAAAERGDALDSADSEAYVRRLVDDPTPSK